MHPASRLFATLMGIYALVVGVALVTDFRSLRRILPRQSPGDGDSSLRDQVARVVGVAFALAGTVLLLYGVFGIGHLMEN